MSDFLTVGEGVIFNLLINIPLFRWRKTCYPYALA
jgi:hypothetical protein